MRIIRRAARRDAVEASIVKALRDAGCDVYEIGWPVDLLVRLPWAVDAFHIARWQPLECKRATAKGKPRLDKRQKEQQAFISRHGVPVVTDAVSALRALGLLR